MGQTPSSRKPRTPRRISLPGSPPHHPASSFRETSPLLDDHPLLHHFLTVVFHKRAIRAVLGLPRIRHQDHVGKDERIGHENTIRPLLASTLASVSFWLVDATMDHYLFSGGSLWDAILFEVPTPELYMCTLGLLFFVGVGAVILFKSIKGRLSSRSMIRELESPRTIYPTSLDAFIGVIEVGRRPVSAWDSALPRLSLEPTAGPSLPQASLEREADSL